MKANLDEDRALLSGCVAGDNKVSETFVRRFSNLVYGTIQHTLIVRHVFFSTQDLEDLHNTVFLNLFENRCKKLKQFQGKNGCSLASWIRVITMRIVLNHLRKKGFESIFWRKQQRAFEEVPEMAAPGSTALEGMAERERERVIHEGIRKLPARERLFLQLHVVQGLSVLEAASAMHLTLPNAYTIKHRAIERLRDHVASYG